MQKRDATDTTTRTDRTAEHSANSTALFQFCIVVRQVTKEQQQDEDKLLRP